MPTPFLPYQRDPIAGSATTPNNWYEFFRRLQENGVDPSVISDIQARIAALEDSESAEFSIQGLYSVRVQGTPSGGIVQLSLEGDEANPGNTFYYGTGPTGDKQWTAVADTVAGADSVVQTVALTGVSTFNLDGDDPAPGLGYTYATHLITGDKGWFRPALFESTGVLSGGALSINAGDNTKFDVAQAIVGSTDYTVGAINPQRSVSIFGPSLGNDVPSLAVVATYVGITVSSGTLAMQSSPFTSAQTRTIAPLGVVISNGVNLIAVNNLPNVMRAGINQIGDLMAAIGPMNLSGNVVSANGANLNINKSAGVVFKQGANFTTDPNNPHGLSLGLLTAPSFQYRLSDGTQFASSALVDPDNYETPLGTLAPISPANRFTIQRFTVFTSNLVRAQYGQFLYGSMAEAEASLSTEAFVTEQNIAENGILLCFLIVQDGTTDLSDPTKAKFIPASKFGGPVGTGGTSITNTDSLPEGSVNLYFTDARALSAAGAVSNAAILTPPQIVANADDYAPTGHDATHTFRLSTDASRNLTGLQGGVSGREVYLCNVGAFDLVLVHDATSTAANRFFLPNSTNLTLNPNDSVRCWYDATSSRWRAIGF